GRNAQGGKAKLREDLHPRALRLRVLRAVRPGVPHRRHHHDEVVRPLDERSPRTPPRQGPAACHRAAARAVLGHGQPAARHADAAEGAQAGSSRGTQGGGRSGSRRRGVSGEVIAFWALAVLLVGSALAVVLSKNLFHSVLWLALALTGTAGI